ncbi:MAG: hypothetical protein AB7I44_06405 [Hyphomicrobiaceae bacterium]
MARRLHLIVHVPKCAGRSIENHLQLHLGAERFWRPGKRTRRLPLEVLGRKYDASPPGPLDNVDAISGHMFGQSIEKLFPDRQLVRSMILREPEKQILSWYNYRMMRYLTEGLHPFSFRLFLQSFPVDPVAQFLLERWLEMPWIRIATLTAAQKVALLDRTLSQFDRIVDIAEADDLCAWHCDDLGIPGAAERTNTAEQWVLRTSWKPLKYRDLAERDRRLLKGRFAVDRYLWRRWALKQDIEFERAAPRRVIPHEPLRPFYEIRLRTARQFGW